MAKQSSVGSSLQGLKALAVALAAMKSGHVDVGFFAGEAARAQQGPAKTAAAKARKDKYTGAGAKAGYFKPGVEYAKRRAALKGGDAEGLTDPELAAKHEFGVGVPRRSMLRMPLHLHGDRIVKQAQADAASSLKDMAKNPQRAAKRVLDRLGVGAVNLVDDAFASGGFGTWKANAPATVALKGSDSPLIDKGELRRAVTWRVGA